MVDRKIFICSPAYNEENNLRSFVASLKKSCESATKKLSSEFGLLPWFEVLICANGCTDNTEDVAKILIQQLSSQNFRIQLLRSAKGVVNAQRKCVRRLLSRGYKKNLVFFIDADVIAGEDTIYKLLRQMILHPSLKATGAHPVPVQLRTRSIYRNLLRRVLNCRSYFPKSEIAIKYAPEFHPFARSDPQLVGPNFEEKSKIYFHGRCFVLRDVSIWDADSEAIGEDTYLDRSIHFRFGPGMVRVLYDANVYFVPLTSLRDYFGTYFRIYIDLKRLKLRHPEFNVCREYSKTKLDWHYIKSLPLPDQLAFVAYAAVRYIFWKLFRLLYGINPNSAPPWEYDSKPKTASVPQNVG